MNLLKHLAILLGILVIISSISTVQKTLEKEGLPIVYETPKNIEEAKKTQIKVSLEEPKAEPLQNSEIKKEIVEQSVVIPSPTLSTQAIEQVNLTDLNTTVRESVVNILCVAKSGDPFKSITGSGVIIDSRGVIITNAHIGQYFLLNKKNGFSDINCTIRAGNPAKPSYKAELLFLPKKWLEKNKTSIVDENPLGTGENDYALILITNNIDGSPLSQTFKALDISTKDSDIDKTTKISHVIAGYPAGFLGGILVEKDLNLLSTISLITQIFTFKEDTIDLVSLGGSILAQKGASGGAVVSGKDKKLIGVIVTTTEGENTSERDLKAITLSHVERSMVEHVGVGIRGYLGGDLNITKTFFNQQTIPYLSSLLKEMVQKQN